MSINFKAPEHVILKPVITVFGIGGAGNNAVCNMLKANLQGAKFVVANTDAQPLDCSICDNKIQLGVTVTKGLGAGASPEVGAAAAVESEEEIRENLAGSNMLFIAAGMGGGTGTGASPIIAKIAKDMEILTVGVVTKPFHFEGAHRMKIAEKGLVELQQFVDTLIVIPNQNLFRIANEKTTFADAFKMADDVLHAGIRSITDLMIMPGLINLDFADVKTIMKGMGKAMMGTGEASGDDRAIKAAEIAISNPLLDHSSMKGAKGVLINITGGTDMTLFEVDSAANRVRSEVGDQEANIIFGSTFNPDLSGIIRVSVVATGIDADKYVYPEASVNDELEVDMLDQFEEETTTEEEEIMQEMEKSFNEEVKENNYIVEEYASTSDQQIITPHTSTSKAYSQKQSIFSRMWGSLKSGNQETPVDIEPQSLNSYERQSKDFETDIQEIPAFIRKKEKSGD